MKKKPISSELTKFPRVLEIPEEGASPIRYDRLRRNLLVLMLLITIIPLVLMAAINYYQYQTRLQEEIVTPLRVLVNKTKHSFELFLTSRLSTINFIATAYPYADLANERKLRSIFYALKSEFEGFVDLGLIDSDGHQISYVGPYELKGKNYANQDWFHQVKVSGVYISDVFKGYRKFPHVVIAVQHLSSSEGTWWIVRATIDTGKFDELIASMGLEPSADAFLMNEQGILQTKSRYYVLLIGTAVFWITGRVVDRLKESDQRRERAVREMQHAHKLASIGRLAAGVAHEINNPLSVIQEKTGLMRDLYQYRPDLPNIKDVCLKHLASVAEAVDRCSSITHRLLGFARRMDVQIDELDVNAVIEDVLGFLEREAMYRNIRLEKRLSEDLIRIYSDRGQLQQAFLNIVNNSFAAVEDGGKIAVATTNAPFDNVAITFQDNGCGMSEETLSYIFEPFFTTKKGQGTGLGLSITHGIIKRLSGEIQVKSTPGKGTTFTIYLPQRIEGVREENEYELESTARR
ncbi:MAG: ATP-binding protein [Deltaproteobacteria bacterium]